MTDIIELLRTRNHSRTGHGLGPVCDAAADEIERLRRWKSTHAPRLEALEGLLSTSQIEAAAGEEAIATLESERAANAILTDEIERLRADLLRIIDTYDAYRRRGVSPAPAEYADVVAAIDAARGKT